MRAIAAVLALRQDAALPQADVIKTFQTSKDSVRKYRDLIDKLPNSGAGVSGSVALGTGDSKMAMWPLLSRDWLARHLPNVFEVR